MVFQNKTTASMTTLEVLCLNLHSNPIHVGGGAIVQLQVFFFYPLLENRMDLPEYKSDFYLFIILNLVIIF